MKYFLGLLLILAACTPPAPPAPPAAQQVTLTASVTKGELPLSVTFNAVADPPAETYSWAVGSVVQAETGATLTTIFNSSGVYVVRVAVAGASANVTVEARAPDLPNTGPEVTELALTQTPPGPAPWAVAYTVDPAVDGVEAQCSDGGGYSRVSAGRFVCLHEPGDVVAARFVDAEGVVTANAETSSKVTENDGVAFFGGWRYSSRGVTETFAITDGDARTGRSADGRFALFTIREQGALVAEFTLDGQTVVLEPTPDEGGRQVFEADVYRLVLEAVPDAPEDSQGGR